MNEERNEVLKRFIRLQRLMHRYQAQNFMSFGPWGNPHRGQGRVLSILKMKPEISQKELSYLLDMSRQSLAELLDKLEKNGYITRQVSEEDRRSFTIRLTETGAAVAGTMEDTPPELDKIFDGLNDEELKQLSDYLKRMIERLEDQVGGDDEDWRRQMAERFMKRHHSGFDDHEHAFDRENFRSFYGGGFHGGWGGCYGCK